MAEKKVWITPMTALRIDWNTAMIEPKIAVMVLKMEAIRLPRESMREGMIAVEGSSMDGYLLV
jgi:hypothetical protein